LNNAVLTETQIANIRSRYNNKFNQETDTRITPLIKEIIGDNYRAVKFLIDNGAKIDHRDYLGNTPLMYAAYYGRGDIVNLMLSYKDVDINARNNIGETALIIAAGKGYDGIVKKLLGLGVNTSYKTTILGNYIIAKYRRENGDLYSQYINPKNFDENTIGLPEKSNSQTIRKSRNSGNTTVLLPQISFEEVNGPNPFVITSRDGYVDDTALSRAKRKKHFEIVNMLENANKMVKN
jgi:ankyrin repeat protein